MHRALERTEQLAERLRLFYVGVTRAVKLCVLCWGKVNEIQDSALAYLLHRDLPEPDGARWTGAPVDPDRLAARVFDSYIDAGWRVASYSALARGEDAERPDYDGSAEPRSTDTDAVSRSSPFSSCRPGPMPGTYCMRFWRSWTSQSRRARF